MMKLTTAAWLLIVSIAGNSGLYADAITTATAISPSASALPASAIPTLREVKQEVFLERHRGILEAIKKSPVDLVFLGDSITGGWSAAKPVWDKYFSKWKPANLGVGGDRTQHVLWRITNGELDGISPKVLVLMIGTNNTHTDTPEDIVAGTRRIIEVVQRKLPDTKVLLLGIFPREHHTKKGASNLSPMENISAVNRELAKLAQPGKVRFLDITSHFLVDGKVPEDVMPDKVHLSKKGYEIWAKAITPTLEEMMK